MIEKKKTEAKDTKRTWLPYAIGSAVFAALTSILGKIGITDVESNLGTAIRTGVVLVMAWLIVFVKGKGDCHRRIMALLLLLHTERRRQRCRTDR